MKRLVLLLLSSLMIAFTWYPMAEARTSSQSEFRGVWIASVTNIDWPSNPYLSAEEQKNEFITILEESKKWG